MGYAIPFVVVLLVIVAAMTKPESSSAWVEAMDQPKPPPAFVPDLDAGLFTATLKGLLMIIGMFLVLGLYAAIALGLLFKLLSWLF